MSLLCNLIVAGDRYNVICSGNLGSRHAWSKRKALFIFVGSWVGTFLAIALIFHQNLSVEELENSRCTFLATSDMKFLSRLLSFLIFGILNYGQVISLAIFYLLLILHVRL